MKIQKRLVDIEDVRSVDGEANTFWFTASTQKRARDGHVIVQDGWKLQNFRKNPVILWAHKGDQLPVGRAIDIQNEGGKLRLKIEFTGESLYPFGAQVGRFVSSKFLRTGSVGFGVYKTEPLTDEEKKQSPEMGDWGYRLYCELFEFSIAPVPSDTGATEGGREEENAFLREGIARSIGAFEDNEAKRSALLPYEKDGIVFEPLLRASWAALHGARGGVAVPDDDFDACARHLQRVAAGAGWKLPPVPSDETESRKLFEDIWNDELLDVVTDGRERSAEEKAETQRALDETELAKKQEEEAVEGLTAAITSLTESLKKP